METAGLLTRMSKNADVKRWILVLLLLPVAATAQTTIDSRGIRTPGVRIDASGVHTGTADITAAGVVARDDAGGRRTVAIAGSDQRRSVDCGGGVLAVSGAANVLTVANCRSVQISGAENRVRIAFGAIGSINVSGSDNSAIWSGLRNGHYTVSNSGSDNTVTRR